jgi:hypothetical protein
MSKHIANTKKRLEKEKDIATSEYLETSLELSTINLSSKSVISRYLDRVQILKDKSNKIEQDLLALKLLSNEVKTIDKILYQKELRLSQPDIQRLIEMLVHEVLVHESYIGIDLFLSTFVKELNAS